MPKHAHNRDLRKHRFSEPNRIYQLTTVTLNRQPIFQDWRIGRLLVTELKRAEQQNLVKSLAWVVMPDHLHWLIELKKSSLPTLMQQFSSVTTDR